MGGDIFGVLLTVLLLAANAFFVGAEFALISARRDRLEALAEQGKRSAVTVIRAGENLSVMLAGAQLGITVCSILLGRVGEPAVAHLLQTPFDLVGVPDALLHTVSFVIAITIVVMLHVLLGEMVPKNIAIAGPESAAMLLVPPVPGLGADRTPGHRVLRLVRPHRAARGGRRGQDRTGEHGVDGRTVRDDRRVAVGGPARSRGAHPAVPGPADPQPRGRRRRDPADRGPRGARGRRWQRPTVSAIEQALAETGYSRFPVAESIGTFIGYLHIKDVLTLGERPRRGRRPLDGAAAAAGVRVAAAARRACRGCGATTATSRWSPATTAA